MRLVHQLATQRTRSQLHAGGVGAIATIIVVGAVVAVPLWSNHARQAELHAAVNASEARLQRSRSQIDQSRRDYTASNDRLTAIEAQPNAARTLDRRLLDISSLASELGLQVDSVEPGSTSKRADGDLTTTIATSGRGPYPRVIAFIHRLREAAPDLTVETAQLSATADRGCAFRLGLGWRSFPMPTPRPISVAGGEP